MNELQHLDYLLGKFRDKPGGFGSLELKELRDDPNMIDHAYFNEVKDKLLKDGYLRQPYSDGNVAISFEGRVLLAQGGYVSQQENYLSKQRLLEKQLKETHLLQKYNLRYSRQVRTLTFALALFAGLTFLLEVYKYKYPKQHEPTEQRGLILAPKK